MVNQKPEVTSWWDIGQNSRCLTLITTASLHGASNAWKHQRFKVLLQVRVFWEWARQRLSAISSLVPKAQLCHQHQHHQLSQISLLIAPFKPQCQKQSHLKERRPSRASNTSRLSTSTHTEWNGQQPPAYATTYVGGHPQNGNSFTTAFDAWRQVLNYLYLHGALVKLLTLESLIKVWHTQKNP